MKLIAVIVGASSAAACLDAAALAARVLGASSVEALNVVVDPDHLVAASEEVGLQRLREHSEGTAISRSDAAHAAFLAWMAGTGDDTPRIGWRSIVGSEDAVIRQEAEGADALIVMARARTMDGADAMHAALFDTGKPVLIVPSVWRMRSGKGFCHVAVGLSDSDTTRRAIEAATPWLRKAERVTAIRIGQAGDQALALETLLNAVCVSHEMRIVPRRDGNLGRQLIEEAEAAKADLLITGAYRHNQLIEWFMGGTIRHLLASAEIPLLMVH